jgi:hypothetical protein
MFGAAWAGETEVTEISVSTNDGQTWPEAEFISGEAETEDSRPRLKSVNRFAAKSDRHLGYPQPRLRRLFPG